MILEEARELESVRLGALHPERQVLTPRRTSHAWCGSIVPPNGVDLAEPLVELGRAGDDRAADDVRVAVDVLRQAVEDDVGPERQRLLEEGRRERVVHDEQRAVACAMSAQAAMSVSFIVGFAGVSTYTSFVDGRIADATFRGFEESTHVEATPKRGYSFSRTRRLGP